ncbi:MAG: acyl-CoA synthetase forming [Rhodospirillales bacterium]|nr:acyl-CoA synthetase forming [Rhodospirillales bacterium]
MPSEPRVPVNNETVTSAAPGGAAVVERLMRPRAVAIIGISSTPNTAGRTMLANLTMNDYQGEIYLVNRSGAEIEGRTSLTTVDELPEGVDLAVLSLPANGVREAIAGCIRRKVGAAVVFAAGFAELNDEGRAEQEIIAKMAREGGLGLVGPNCLGYTNYVDSFAVGFAGASKVVPMARDAGPGIALIGQSGGLIGHARMAYDLRGLPVSYTISTGNEAGLGVADFLDYLAKDPATGVVVVYAEHIRHPAAFLKGAATLRAAGKTIVLMHPGRGKRAQEAARSHTGALAGDYAVMRTYVEHHGIVLVETLEQLSDVVEILTRYPKPPSAGIGVVTFSGAFCGIVYDFCEDVGLEVPPLSATAEATLTPLLPSFAPPRNPLDLTTQPIWQPDLIGIGAKALLDDPAIGSLIVSVTVGQPQQSIKYMHSLLKAFEGNTKPVVLSILGDGSPLAPEFNELAAKNRLIQIRSPERALRAIATITAHGKRIAAAASRAVTPAPFAKMPAIGKGTLAEWEGKKILAAAGIAVPKGDLARNADEAVAVAKRIGYPVALKAQAAALTHKSDAGGVILRIADEASLRAAWRKLTESVARAQPGLELDGALVETMGAPGLELVVGARRDPEWGPVLLVGLGGIWIEALGDVRLLPPDLPEEAIVEEILKLRAAKLLHGFRGAPPVDVKAVARTVAAVGRLMQTVPDMMEIDVNPLVAYPDGVIALDALIVMR